MALLYIVKLRMPLLPISFLLAGTLVGGDTTFDGVSMNTTFLLSTNLFVFAL